MGAIEAVLVTVAALLPIVNPLGTAPIFLAWSRDLPPAARTHLAWVVTRNALILLVAAMLFGSHVLSFFGISIPIVRVAGGLVVLSTGWKLLHAGDELDAPKSVMTEWQSETKKRGFYPLTFPLTIGPGSISVAITLGAGNALNRAEGLLRGGAYLVGLVVVAVAIYICYRFSPRIGKVLGETGTSVFLRLSSFILLCVGVAIFWSGLTALLKEAGIGFAS